LVHDGVRRYHFIFPSAGPDQVNVTCENCQKRYTIADDKVRGKAVKIRCRHCQNVITVGAENAEAAPAAASKPAPPVAAPPPPTRDPWDEEPTRAAPMMDLGAVWFAMVKGKQVGPLDVKGLDAKVRGGDISLRTYLWKQGMAEWKRASDIPELSRLLGGGVGAVSPPPSPVITAPRGAPASTGGSGGSGGGVSARPSSSRAPHQDVAIGMQEPAPELTGKKRAEENPDPLGELFSDAELGGGSVVPTGKRKIDPDELGVEQEKKSKKKKKEEPAAPGVASSSAPADPHAVQQDPFAQFADIDPTSMPPPGESTRFFIAQAGVNKRNPPWKIALFIFALVGLPVGTLYALSELRIVPLQVTRVNASGQVETVSVFSGEGISNLGDILSGKAAKKREDALKAAQKPVDTPRKPSEPPPVKVAQPVKPAANPGLAGFYAEDTGKTTTIPKVRNNVQTVKTSSGDIDEKAVGEVVGKSMQAFEKCIELELRKNPNFRGGKVNIAVTVGPSGVVKGATIDKMDIDRSDIGLCLKDKAKRMVFPAFSGDEEAEVQIPLILTSTM
jgi:predicted Zn finger-like uncharacterized protein